MPQVNILANLRTIQLDIQDCAIKAGRNDPIKLLAASKNRSVAAITQLLDEGQRLFGENRVQEACEKWPVLKVLYPDIELHLIGHLQTNKVKEAINLFDTIETLDSFRLAEKLMIEEKKQNKRLTYYIEINIGKEPQKTGIWPDHLDDFLTKVRNYFLLNIQGLMCIPPLNEDPVTYFQELKNLADYHHLPIVSMGMSDDYELAIQNGANLVRIGTALFI